MSSRVVGGFDSNRKPSDRLYDRTETWRRSFQPPPSLPGLRSLRFACRLAPVWRDRELNNQSIRYQRLFLHEHKEKKMKRYKRERMKHNFVRFQRLQTDQNISCTFKIKAWVLLVSLHVCPLKHTHTHSGLMKTDGTAHTLLLASRLLMSPRGQRLQKHRLCVRLSLSLFHRRTFFWSRSKIYFGFLL